MIVDFRKQLDGLIIIIVDALDKDPSSVDPAINTFSLRILHYNSLKLKKNYLLEN